MRPLEVHKSTFMYLQPVTRVFHLYSRSSKNAPQELHKTVPSNINTRHGGTDFYGGPDFYGGFLLPDSKDTSLSMIDPACCEVQLQHQETAGTRVKLYGDITCLLQDQVWYV